MSDLDRDIYEVSNQLGGYVGPGTEERLAKFLIRESNEAAKLADEIVRLQRELSELREISTDKARAWDALNESFKRGRRKAFIEAAEIASTATVHVSYGTLSMERDEPIAYRSLIAAALRAKAEEIAS